VTGLRFLEGKGRRLIAWPFVKLRVVPRPVEQLRKSPGLLGTCTSDREIKVPECPHGLSKKATRVSTAALYEPTLACSVTAHLESLA
jgi:hypothetical protein